MPIVLSLAIKLAQINDLVEDYTAREISSVRALDDANEQMQDKRSFVIPEVPDVDLSCKSFFIQSKRVLQDLLDIASGFFGNDLERRYFSNLQDLAKRKYGEDDLFYQYLDGNEKFREFVRVARNCIEHENAEERAIISNTRMNAAAEITLPTFELIHPNYAQEEVGVRSFLETMFSSLVEFSETLLAHMVAKNIDNSKTGLTFELIQVPETRRSNPNVRYGFGVILDGELRPIG